jgi:hypothetical protein
VNLLEDGQRCCTMRTMRLFDGRRCGTFSFFQQYITSRGFQIPIMTAVVNSDLTGSHVSTWHNTKERADIYVRLGLGNCGSVHGGIRARGSASPSDGISDSIFGKRKTCGCLLTHFELVHITAKHGTKESGFKHDGVVGLGRTPFSPVHKLEHRG